MASAVGTLSEAAGASERLTELLEQEQTIASPPRPARLPTPAAGRIEIVDLQFASPSNSGATVLSDLCVNIEPNEKVALVGPSGSGKSTLFLLLLQFCDIQTETTTES